MTTSASRRALTSALVLASAIVFFPSCTKEKPTTAVITVKMEDGTLVRNAYVKLYANPTYPTGDQPVGIAFDGSNIWVTNANADTVTKMVP